MIIALNPSFGTNLIGSVLRIRRIDRNEDQSDYLAEILIPEKPEGDLKPALRAVLEEVPLADNSLAASP